jgi:hypothetical protein
MDSEYSSPQQRMMSVSGLFRKDEQFPSVTHDFGSLRRDLIAVAIKNGPRRARRASFVDLDISIMLSKDAAVHVCIRASTLPNHIPTGTGQRGRPREDKMQDEFAPPGAISLVKSG